MSNRPEQHPDEEQVEAARLESIRAECRALIEQKRTVEAVRRYRVATGCSLREAKIQIGLK